MAFDWKDLNMRDLVSVFSANRLSDRDQEVLMALYQPIIGVTASSLYLYLFQLARQAGDVVVSHQTILNHLAIGMHDYQPARIKLEAMGLVKTFQNESNPQEPRFALEVLPPVSAQTFLSDPIYCGLLKDMIGEADYERLKAQYLRPEPLDKSVYHDISLDFYKVFGKHLSVQLEDKDKFMGDSKASLKVDKERYFNWTFLSQLLQATFIREDMLTADVKTAIESIYQLYGIEPVTMRDMLLQSHNLAQGNVNIDKLYQLARQEVKASTTAKALESEHQKPQKQGNKKANDFLTLVEETASVDFLAMIKASKNKQNPLAQKILVDKSEIQLVERLVLAQGIPMSVVNVLIYHLLVTLQMDSLNDRYAVRTANDWIKQGISSAQEAMVYLDSREARIKKDQEQRQERSRGGRKVTKVISLTDEERTAMKGTSTPLSEEERQKLLSRLK